MRLALWNYFTAQSDTLNYAEDLTDDSRSAEGYPSASESEENKPVIT